MTRSSTLHPPRSTLHDIAAKAMAGERLSFDDGVRLYQCPDLTAVGALANIVRERKHGDRTYWVRNQHINYTNVCNKFCKFCSFYVPPGAEGAYALSPEQVQERVRKCLDQPVTEIHIVAGINPKLPYDYYLDILRAVKELRPEAHIKAFTMIELAQIARMARKPLEETLLELKEAGLSSIPGGGAEMFSERVRSELFPLKMGAQEWLQIARTAHRVGLRSNATMLYGHIEMPEEKVDHLLRLRDLQDETGGFLCYVPLAFHPERTEMADLPPTTGQLDLREIAVARLLLDNFDHIKAFWVMITPPVAQAALWYGADDMDGTVVEYEIIGSGVGGQGSGVGDQESEVGGLTGEQLTFLIREAGREPVERDALYGERGKGNGERGNGKGERGNGNGERGKGKGERGKAKAGRGRDSLQNAKCKLQIAKSKGQTPREQTAAEDEGQEIGHWSLVIGHSSRGAPMDDIAEKVFGGRRLDSGDGLRLFEHPNLINLAFLADTVRRRLHPDRIVTYIVGRNINYTNVCWVRCKFCAFYRLPGDSAGWTLSHEEIFRKIEELLALDGIELLMQGGLNPNLKIGYYEDLFSQIKSRYPVHLHALSPTEILYISRISKLSLEETLRRLRAAGLDTIPGGGAEILSDEIREQIAPYKESTDHWLEVMRTAHGLGMRTTATMMYGSVEDARHRVEHLLRVRDLQDETGGFTAFIPWNFQPGGTELGATLHRSAAADGLPGGKATGFDYLRTVAVSRVILDNVPNIQASWVTQGEKLGQVALSYGVNDFGSTMMEENVISAGTSAARVGAGAETGPSGRFAMSPEDIERLIRDAGYEPRRRNTYYEILQ